MENKQRTINENALYYGLLTGLALIIYSLILYIFDASTNKTLGYFSMLILALAMFLSAKSYRDQSNDGFISYSRALGASVLTALYASVLLGLYTFIFYKYIDPEAIKPLLEAAETEMYKQGLEDRELDQAMEMTKKFMTPGWMLGMTTLTNMFWGTLIALITSIFVKREQKI